MSRNYAFVPIAISSILLATACSQTPIVVPVRSMERPRDVDFICLQQLDGVTWKGVPLDKCAVDLAGKPVSGTADYRPALGFLTNFTDSTIQVISLDPRAGLLDDELVAAGGTKADPGTIGPLFGQVIYTIGVVQRPGT